MLGYSVLSDREFWLRDLPPLLAMPYALTNSYVLVLGIPISLCLRMAERLPLAFLPVMTCHGCSPHRVVRDLLREAVLHSLLFWLATTGIVAIAMHICCTGSYDPSYLDTLAQAGADMVLVKLGANDLIHPHCRSKQGLLTPVTFAQMTAGYRALADMAHAQGVRIWFCELTPWKGYTRNLFGRGDDIQWSPELDALRPELNAWFQSADCPADGYIPLDALADPDDPDALIASYTTDGVHHTPAGQRALAALIPEDIFREPPKEVHP